MRGILGGFTKVATASFFLLLASCVSYEDSDFSEENSLSSFEKRKLCNADLEDFFKKNNYDKDFSVEKLSVIACYYRNRINLAEVNEFLARIDLADTNPYPIVIGASPAINSTQVIPSRWIVDPSVEFTIETFGKKEKRKIIAQEEYKQQLYRTKTAEWEIRNEIRTSMLSIYSARVQLEKLKKYNDVLSEICKKIGNQVKYGEKNLFEMSVYVKQKRVSDLAIVEMQKKESVGMSTLAKNIGVPEKALEGVKLNFDNFEKVDFIKNPQENAMHNRTDLMEALYEYNIADAKLKLEIAKQYPDILLSPGYEYDQGDNKWKLGLYLNIPYPTHILASIDVAKESRKVAIQKFEILQSQIVGEANEAYQSCKASEKSLHTSEIIVNEIKAYRDIIYKSYKLGERSELDTLIYEAEFLSAELDNLNKYFQLQQDIGLLEKTTQTAN